jgi:pimeloyl-ACP methyl ester carboxylesterase
MASLRYWIGILAAGAVVAVPTASGSGPALTLKPCLVNGVTARCGTFVVPENRAEPNGRTIGLRVVVVPAWLKPVAKDAVAYLAGGPGGAATADVDLSSVWSALNAHRDFLFVDQRGTGRSHAYSCPSRTKPFASRAELRAFTLACLKAFGGDVTQYGTRAAMDDLDAVRAALGYRQLDVIGGSYGATAAQVYLKLHPSSVRTLTLEGGTAIDVPFFGRYAVNSQRALDQLAKLCTSQPACRKTFPNWKRQFGQLADAWNAHPVQTSKGVVMTGDRFASVVHSMLIDLKNAVSIPLIVSRAAKGDYSPLNSHGPGDLGEVSLQLMTWSVWCNEPWAGLQAKGPWGTQFDSYTAARIQDFRQGCTFMPRRAEPRALWTLPSNSRVPVLAVNGGADPQDPTTNLGDLKRHFPDSRVVTLPHTGHQFGAPACVSQIITGFVGHGTTKSLKTGCAQEVVVPPFPLTG